jgi:hypothetical protein
MFETIAPIAAIATLIPAVVTTFIAAWREGNRVAAAEAAAETVEA